MIAAFPYCSLMMDMHPKNKPIIIGVIPDELRVAFQVCTERGITFRASAIGSYEDKSTSSFPVLGIITSFSKTGFNLIEVLFLFLGSYGQSLDIFALISPLQNMANNG